MALSSLDMNTLASLRLEQKTVQFVNGHAKERWDLNDNEMSVVEKWINNRILELENQKKKYED